VRSRARRRIEEEDAAEVLEAVPTPAPAPPASSPLAEFLADAEAALSGLREIESERGSGEAR
jgi:hypothetical protein